MKNNFTAQCSESDTIKALRRKIARLEQQQRQWQADEAKLRRQEELLRLFVEHTPAPVAMFDTQMCYIACSRRWRKDHNLMDTDPTGRCHYELIADIPEHWKDEHRRCLAGEVIQSDGELFHRADGRTDWIRRRLYNWRGADGEIGGIILYSEIVTEQKKMQQALQNSEARYRSVFENAGTATLIIEPDMTISMVNAKAVELSGYTRQEIEGRMVTTDFVIPEDRPRITSYHTLRRSPNASKIPDEYEITLIDNAGVTKDVVIKIAMIPGTQKSIASLTDITMRKQAERALHRSEEKYRTILESIEEGYFETDFEGKLLFFNPALCDIVGYFAHELRAMDLRELVSPSAARKMTWLLSRIYRTGEKASLNDLEIVKKGGDSALLEVSVSLKKDAHKYPTGFRGFVRDISDRLRAEQELRRMEAQMQQAQKLESLGTLAGGIAHDFNNLLMGIQGNVSLIMLKTNPEAPVFGKLKNIEQHINSGSNLTRQLLGFARGGKYQVTPVNPNDLVRSTSNMFGRTRREIKIHSNLQKNVKQVTVDAGQIEQVLLNVYVNAWHAMPWGGNLYLSTRNVRLNENETHPHEVKPGPYVEISIRDEGVGMDSATIARVFEPFFTTKEVGRGTGMGLASAFGIIKNHAGIIRIESEVNQGTTVFIYLAASNRTANVATSSQPSLLKGTETILLVDDEELVLEVGRSMLSELGYTVHVANGGKQAIAIYAAEKDRIDLVILDVVMPDMGGSETFDRLISIDPTVKVLLSTGYSKDGQAKNILERGCAGFLQKPYSLEILSQKIRQIFK